MKYDLEVNYTDTFGNKARRADHIHKVEVLVHKHFTTEFDLFGEEPATK